jgi:hypothetical protein
LKVTIPGGRMCCFDMAKTRPLGSVGMPTVCDPGMK